MSIDLDSTEGRKEYLSEKLDDLLEGINNSYGTLLMDELLSRLELTVKDFNDEMKDLCEGLVTKEKERQQLLEMLKTADSLPNQTVGSPDSTESLSSPMDDSQPLVKEGSDENVPEWEKKLAKLEKK